MYSPCHYMRAWMHVLDAASCYEHTAQWFDLVTYCTILMLNLIKVKFLVGGGGGGSEGVWEGKLPPVLPPPHWMKSWMLVVKHIGQT